MSGFSIPSRGSHLTDCLSEGGGALEGRFSSSYKDKLFLLLEHVEDFVMERMLTSCTGIL